MTFSDVSKITRLWDEVSVYWIDSCNVQSSWVALKEIDWPDIRESLNCRTSGFLIRIDDDFVAIAGSVQAPWDDNGPCHVDYVIAIPHAAIERIAVHGNAEPVKKLTTGRGKK